MTVTFLDDETGIMVTAELCKDGSLDHFTPRSLTWEDEQRWERMTWETLDAMKSDNLDRILDERDYYRGR